MGLSFIKRQTVEFNKKDRTTGLAESNEQNTIANTH